MSVLPKSITTFFYILPMEGFDEGVNISSTVEAVMVVVWVVEDGISVLCLQFF